MSFEGLITRIPRTFSDTLGAESASYFFDHPKNVRSLIHGVAGTSPYLKTLIDKERVWLNSVLSDPHNVTNDITQSLHNNTKLSAALRIAKRRMALWVALCDLGGLWTLEKVMQSLTDFAEIALKHSLAYAFRYQVEKARPKGFVLEEDLNKAGIFVLAMGKMGAGELNYSSDIDLICLFDDSRFGPLDFDEARRVFIKTTRKMVSMLNDITSDGYVFRTDLRLRPDPSVTPVCIGTEAAERYYESLGRTWERAAYIKARVAAGDFSAGSDFLSRIQPFVWRKHLDFAAIEDAHNMRLAIRDHKGFAGTITPEGHDLKLGRGGIREIEFFTQTRQLISGGRDPSLRDRQTLCSLTKLAEKKWITKKTATALSNHYRVYRKVEHRLQMLNDAQTHTIPTSSEAFLRLSCLMDQDVDDLRSELLSRLHEVHELTEGFFVGPSILPNKTEEEEGFKGIVASWENYPALRSKRARKVFERLKPELLKRIKAAGKHQEAIIAFDGFLAGLPTGVQLFSMFEAFPKLIDLLIDIVSTSPALANYLARNSQVFDAVIGGSFWNKWPGQKKLVSDLRSQLITLSNYETKLDAARRWHKELHFRIGVHILRGLVGGAEAGRQYADLAEAIIKSIWPEVIEQFSMKHGRPPGRGAIVLGMGSIGMRRLHSGSDLDLIVIYDAENDESSYSNRPLAARQYYARLTQALVTALSVQMAEGRLYEVDMRLRPSGNKGPVATSWSSFQSYQKNDAWIWEHLALSRARVIAGPKSLMKDVEKFRINLLGKTSPKLAKVALAKMRRRIAQFRGDGLLWDTKNGTGRLHDIEMIAQLGRLLEGGKKRDVISGLNACVTTDILTKVEERELRKAYKLFWTLRVALKLLGQSGFESSESTLGTKNFLMSQTGYKHLENLEADLSAKSSVVSGILDRALPLLADNHDEG